MIRNSEYPTKPCNCGYANRQGYKFAQKSDSSDTDDYDFQRQNFPRSDRSGLSSHKYDSSGLDDQAWNALSSLRQKACRFITSETEDTVTDPPAPFIPVAPHVPLAYSLHPSHYQCPHELRYGGSNVLRRANDLIDYAPQSEFLRKMKQQCQLLSNNQPNIFSALDEGLIEDYGNQVSNTSPRMGEQIRYKSSPDEPNRAAFYGQQPRVDTLYSNELDVEDSCNRDERILEQLADQRTPSQQDVRRPKQKKKKSTHISRSKKPVKCRGRRKRKSGSSEKCESEDGFEPTLKKPHENSCERCWRYASPSRSPVNKPDQRFDPNFRRGHSCYDFEGGDGDVEGFDRHVSPCKDLQPITSREIQKPATAPADSSQRVPSPRPLSSRWQRSPDVQQLSSPSQRPVTQSVSSTRQKSPEIQPLSFAFQRPDVQPVSLRQRSPEVQPSSSVRPKSPEVHQLSSSFQRSPDVQQLSSSFQRSDVQPLPCSLHRYSDAQQLSSSWQKIPDFQQLASSSQRVSDFQPMTPSFQRSPDPQQLSSSWQRSPNAHQFSPSFPRPEDIQELSFSFQRPSEAQQLSSSWQRSPNLQPLPCSLHRYSDAQQLSSSWQKIPDFQQLSFQRAPDFQPRTPSFQRSPDTQQLSTSWQRYSEAHPAQSAQMTPQKPRVQLIVDENAKSRDNNYDFAQTRTPDRFGQANYSPSQGIVRSEQSRRSRAKDISSADISRCSEGIDDLNLAEYRNASGPREPFCDNVNTSLTARPYGNISQQPAGEAVYSPRQPSPPRPCSSGLRTIPEVADSDSSQNKLAKSLEKKATKSSKSPTGQGTPKTDSTSRSNGSSQKKSSKSPNTSSSGSAKKGKSKSGSCRQESEKSPEKSPQKSPKSPQRSPKSPQRSPKSPQSSPKSPQRSPKGAQKSPRSPPKSDAKKVKSSDDVRSPPPRSPEQRPQSSVESSRREPSSTRDQSRSPVRPESPSQYAGLDHQILDCLCNPKGTVMKNVGPVKHLTCCHCNWAANNPGEYSPRTAFGAGKPPNAELNRNQVVGNREGGSRNASRSSPRGSQSPENKSQNYKGYDGRVFECPYRTATNLKAEQPVENTVSSSFERECQLLDKLQKSPSIQSSYQEVSRIIPHESSSPRTYFVLYMTKCKENKGEDVEVLVEELTQTCPKKTDSRTKDITEKMKKIAESPSDSMALRFQKGVSEQGKIPQNSRILYF